MHEVEEISVATRFKLLISSACETFELLQASISDPKIGEFFGATRKAALTRALADAFILSLYRARRLMRQAEDQVSAAGVDTTSLFAALALLRSIRTVTEHGLDETRDKNAKAKLHVHDDGTFLVDETSMVIQGPTQIFRGPANLYDLYSAAKAVDESLGWS